MVCVTHFNPLSAAFLVPVLAVLLLTGAAPAHGAAQRVLPLAPNLVEMVYALGAGERVVGRPQFADWPVEARKLPVIGSYVRPELEHIVRLQPDLCLALRDGTPSPRIERLRAMGVPVLTLHPQTPAAMLQTLETIGQTLGKQVEAQRLTAELRTRMKTVEERVRRLPRRPRVVLQVQAAPLLLAGPTSFMGSLLELAGGDNPVRGEALYPRLSLERAILLQPEVIVSAGMEDSQDFRLWQAWQQVPAVRNNRLYVMDPDLLTRPSPRSVDALEQLVAIMEDCTRGER